jgi:hypothetical protein
MTSPYLQLPLRGLEDVLNGRRAEASPPLVLVGMPETPEGVALCLLMMILERQGGGVMGEAELLALYGRCARQTNARWSEADPAPWQQ